MTRLAAALRTLARRERCSLGEARVIALDAAIARLAPQQVDGLLQELEGVRHGARGDYAPRARQPFYGVPDPFGDHGEDA